MNLRIRIYLFLLVLLAGCSAPYELAERNLAALYTPGAQFTEPEYRVFHLNDSVSELYLTLNTRHFLYAETRTGTHPQAKIKVTASFYESYESKNLIDSSSITLVDSGSANTDNLLMATLRLNTHTLDEGIIRIRVQDMMKDDYLQCIAPFMADDLKGAQSFKVFDGNGQLLMRNTIARNDSVLIVHPHHPDSKLFVRYYRRKFPVASPPFTIDQDLPFDYKADNYFEYSLKNGVTDYLKLTDEGFYFFQTDSLSRLGLSLYRFGPGFPELTTVEQILEPLRYITTIREYEVLENSEDLKLAVDSFWLEKSGNVNRARSQIARFYNRVQEANKLFTSYLEGWKTDRGMIYIVFGPPNSVYRQTNTELWVYGEAGHALSVRFSFVKVNNPFTDNDYSLYRNPMFKEAWYNAVENWRR